MKAKNAGWTRRKFLLGTGVLGAAVAGAGGYWYLDRKAAYRRAVTYRGPLATAEDLRSAEPFDVCIIGSGPAGVVLGLDLARRGVRTLIVESGSDLQAAATDERVRALHRSTNAGSITYPADASRVRALGGTSNIWTGRCSRLHPLDFEPNAYTPPGAAWPLTYAQLQPHYRAAEQTLRVRGGSLSHFHAPREAALPLPADADISGLKDLLRNVGVVVDDSPTSTSPNGGGPVRVAGDLLPDYSAQPSAALVSGLTVTRLIADDSGRIVGAEAKDLDRRSHVLRARVYVVAGGAIESARLLLMSRSGRFPAGVGNEHDQVGRFFNEHPNLNFRGMIEHTWSTLSPRHALGRCHQYYDDFKRKGLGSLILVFVQSWLYPDDLKRWGVEELSRKAQDMVSRMAKAELRISATLEMQPVASNRVTLAREATDYFGNPLPEVHLTFSERDQATMSAARRLIRRTYERLRGDEVEEQDLTWSHHHLGTCRMGADPRTSVTDANQRVHGCSNLYVAGSACFVTGGAAHPTLAIAALSHRLAAHLHSVLQAGIDAGSGTA